MADIGAASRRPTLYGSRHAVSAGHHLAAAAGFAVLEAGGNAVDAGCCAGICLGVLHSDEVNVAGVAPIMIRTAEGRVETIAGLGHWPQALDPQLFMREHDGQIPLGVLRTVVPAAPDAWITALRDFGTMTFGDVAGAAIRHAREGFAVFPYLAEDIAENADALERWPSVGAIFAPGGRPLTVGDRFVQADLAATIQHMADEEAAAPGDRAAGLEAARAAFYEGDIAAAIVVHQRDQGGLLDRDDLAAFRSRYEPPVRIRWRDFEVLTCGPWCQGPVLAQALRMLEETAPIADDPHDADHIHLVTEVLKAAFADREYRYGDPAMVDVGLDELLSDAHVRARLEGIDMRRAEPAMPPPLGRPFDLGLLPPVTEEMLGARPMDTSYVCAIDRWGNAFSATPSDGAFCSPAVPGLGIVPSSRGDQSRPDPRHPSGVAPGKRPRLTPNPAIAVRDDGSVFTFGCPGGDMQVQAMLQVFLNVFHFGMDVQEAINAPRFSTWSFPDSFAPFEYRAGLFGYEDRFPQSVVDDLELRGHRMERWPEFTRWAAAVEAIYLDAESGFLRAGADPRQPAYAIVD